MCSGTTLTEMKVFSSIFRQSFDSRSVIATVALTPLIALIAGCGNVLADIAEVDAVMVQCRNLAADQTDYKECLTILERESELALAGMESDWAELVSGTETQTPAALPEVEQLQQMATQFREYRSKLCEFSVKELDQISVVAAGQACRVSMNRQHARFLRQLYIERRARRTHGDFYRGYFLMAEDKGLFQSCELRQDWVIDTDESLREIIMERYREVTTEALELVYVEWRGRVLNTEDLEAVMRVSRLNLMRPILDSDCNNSLPSAETDSTPEGDRTESESESGEVDVANNEVAGEPPPTVATTIDNYGAAGFTYGYFGDWTSACAADARQVCQAQVQHSLSTEGDWRLLIDRSSSLMWRVRLVPTSNSHFVGSGLQLSLDGVVNTTIEVASKQILLDQPYTLLQGASALKFINGMKNGATLELLWNGNVQGNSSLIFPLNGVALALNYFDTQ